MGTPFKMKGSPMQRNFGIGGSPMQKPGKTSTWGKIKSAVGAVKDTLVEEYHNPAGHGTYDSTSHRFSGYYKNRKKGSRKAEENKK